MSELSEAAEPATPHIRLAKASGLSASIHCIDEAGAAGRAGIRSTRLEVCHLRIERAQIRRQRDHVVIVELFDRLLHQLDPRALTIADLHVVELAEDIGRGPAGDARHLAKALEIRTMTDRAGNGLALAACHQRGAFGYAARRHVVYEARMRITQLGEPRRRTSRPCRFRPPLC